MEALRVASLFCGCGGTDIGILGDFDYLGKNYASNNTEIVYANDIEQSACDLFEANFGLRPDNRDIRQVKSEEIPEFDILTGGFPVVFHCCPESKTTWNQRRKRHALL